MTRWDALAIAVTLAAAYGLKRHYSVASVDELDWILRPTAALVATTDGTPFARIPGEGYVSHDRFFVIAKACAGVNFLIVAFCAPVLAFVRDLRRPRDKALLVLGSAAAAYVATLVINAARIAIAVRLAGGLAEADAPARAQAHRVEGVLVYTLALCLFFLLARRVVASATRHA